MKLSVVILAAGRGTRMRSDLPKVAHRLAGRPMLAHVVETAERLKPAAIHVVYGHGGERVRAALRGAPVSWVEQARQLGTGHAVNQALPAIPDDHRVLVLYGDVPLVSAETLARLVEPNPQGVNLLTVTLDDPHGYGRIVRDDRGVQRIVEQKDASPRELAIKECNTGLLVAPAEPLRRWLGSLSNDNAQGEYYLTDIIERAVGEGLCVEAVSAADADEVQGCNDRVQLARLERAYQRRAAQRLMREGVALADPARFDLRGTLSTGRDCYLDVGCVFEGTVRLGHNVEIGPHCVIRNADIGDGCRIESHSVIDGARLAAECRIGPYARLRPGSELARGAKVGNFVETKQTRLGEGAKVNHLSYIGDAEVGAGTNIGAGTITCNYDGANKHRTEIGAGAFIGSGTQLVAPVRIGEGATIGAGSTIGKNAPADALTLTRAPQKSLRGWRRPRKNED
ncbi:bifunctional UDP-N-acetylglucosamine diphosphorylase/glucosamine-1-phosphate N-acetyltransferase GlmU [Alkalilimnicola sp. S0819]|uniref:bifunctional UDP-N-acetylglucosamine diphosphorylase/glucosamine-1-phosphate N-acetyltransferase GlmU n=1 Tax=Alkalilimnicola sp. S0819 TaxID=2613922 RepID=UPI0012619511|nr:bifunctional UDP-N-acetylglucosamine diphosphorylase/glucosamine-1-phosphate N-acetyltransferase GlmU [Alkalilimnicola sp. S0819]KAB7624208.1 UDP-N-acetylglucosamine diphosphorylase/glucosamine-1-phosphate N-acetyltransferase [Alkalilimnicola sp. S0819]MPQ16463.1 UDP-N-acetylglucosamine diphosphorylase/glucosamine-1-phosphate N-acetyltransferase [Alkalilimnicola sp. S0819]